MTAETPGKRGWPAGQRVREDTRNQIKVTMLLKRLQDFAMEKEGVVIDPDRLKAIEILLRKALPDLKAVDHTGGAVIEIITNIQRNLK